MEFFEARPKGVPIIGCVVGWGATNRGAADLEVTSEGEFVIGNIDHRPDDRLGPIKDMLDAVRSLVLEIENGQRSMSLDNLAELTG